MRRFATVTAILALALAACTRPAAISPPVPQMKDPPAAQVQTQPAPSPTPTAQVTPPQTARLTPPHEINAQKEYQESLDLISAGKYSEAEKKLKSAVEKDSQFAEAWNDLAFVRLKRFDSEFSPHPALPGHGWKEQPAVVAARRALAIRPGWDFAQYNLGVALLANGEYAAAVAPLQESARQQPDRPEPLTALGLALMGAERFEEAAAACHQALAVDGAYRVASACLDELADGGTRLPATEATIGSFRWDSAKRDFRWAGEPEKEPAGEFGRISPPWICTVQYANGYHHEFADCRMDPWHYSWGGRTAAAGTTPAGVGVGTPLDEVTRIYGAARQSGDRLMYPVGDLVLVFQLDEKERVYSYYFGVRSPYFLIEGLIKA